MQTELFYKGRCGTYRVTDPYPFAFGRISVLWKGVDSVDGPVCIKVFRNSNPWRGDERPHEDFFRELRAQQTLKHSHILPIIDFGSGTTENPSPFLILPLCSQGNLRELMRGRDFMPFDEAFPILFQIALAIDFAHKSGFIHGDVKPENVLFSEDYSHAYLCDFGMSKYFSISEEITTAPSYQGGGSSAYLSPEQLNDGEQTPSSDIYSFGILAFEMLTGRLPFDVGVAPIRQMILKIEGKLFDPRDINSKITHPSRTALVQALKVSAKDRPRTALEFCQMFIKTGEPRTQRSRKSSKFWNSLEPVNKVAIITATIAALAGLLAAAISLLR